MILLKSLLPETVKIKNLPTSGWDKGSSVNEDWFDDYLAYEKKVFDELSKRFKINRRMQMDLSTAFGIKLEKGYKKDIPSKKLAFALVPKGKTLNITRCGNA